MVPPFILLFISMYVCMVYVKECMCFSMHVEGTGQLYGVDSLFPPLYVVMISSNFQLYIT